MYFLPLGSQQTTREDDMDPLVLIGMFFGGGLIFIAIFVVIMAKFGKGGPASTPDDKHGRAADAMNQVRNSNNF